MIVFTDDIGTWNDHPWRDGYWGGEGGERMWEEGGDVWFGLGRGEVVVECLVGCLTCYLGFIILF